MNVRQQCDCLTLKPFPFGASLSAGFGWLLMTTPQYIFTYVLHSHLLGGPIGLAQRGPPFLPAFHD